VLGVPLSDTFFAIVRRVVNKKPISVADKNHLHHSILSLGYSHRQTVLAIYGIAFIFGVVAVTLSQKMAVWLTIAILVALVIGLQIGAELLGLVHHRRKPVLRFARKVGLKTIRIQRNISQKR
jgi:UDP-GlcNAc:undecaprenyl-phosphate GlcNAc-1-phosphate transferase